MKAIVISPICPLMEQPSDICQRVDEVLHGMVVDILCQVNTDWYQVQTPYRYVGYVAACHLLLDASAVTRWQALTKMVVWHGICDIQAWPSIRAWQRFTLLRGALVSPVGAPTPDGWQQLSLPDGTDGFCRPAFLRAHATAAHSSPATLRAALVSTACLYLGTPYRWGGKTPLGIDCSGLTAMTYLLHGIIIYRDAQIQHGFALHPIKQSALQHGDLLFFPGHVALYLGAGKYIHSTAHEDSNGVVINSLQPQDHDYRADLAQNLRAIGSFF